MLLALVENGIVYKHGHYKELFPNCSFGPNGPDDTFLAEHNAKKVKISIQHDKSTHRLEAVYPYFNEEDGHVYLTRAVEKNTEELNIQTINLWEMVRKQRNNYLKESDWTQFNDSPLTTEEKEEWKTYRQNLRDITTQLDPQKINWPTKPGEDPEPIEMPETETVAEIPPTGEFYESTTSGEYTASN